MRALLAGISVACAVTAAAFDCGATPGVRLGAEGLWRLHFLGGKSLTAADCEKRADCVRTEKGNVTTWQVPEVRVAVTRTEGADYTDYVAEITCYTGTVIECRLPARLRFDAADVARVVAPQSCQFGPGIALNRHFFEKQPRPVSWHGESVGPQGFRQLLGEPPPILPWGMEPVPLTVTPAGEKIFSAELRKQLAGAKVRANRPARPGTSDVVLLDTPQGAWLSGKRLGEKGGMIWRVGGGIYGADQKHALSAVTALLADVVAHRVPGRNRIAVIALEKGPKREGSDVPVATWITRVSCLEGAGVQFVRLESLEAFEQALASGEYRLILNPYGEAVPVSDKKALPQMLARIGDYVKQGGTWVGTGGLDFHHAFVPDHYLVHEQYLGFMDWLHYTDKNGQCFALYGVQKRPPHVPWQSPVRYLKGEMLLGADAQGGWMHHLYLPVIKAGETRRLPAVRILRGVEKKASIARYAADNGFTRKLTDKLSPEKLATFKRAPLLFVSGRATDMTAMVPLLPKPTFFHIACYLQGGWDHQYPDFLPPHEGNFGNAAEFRALIDTLHAAGHLFSPYTNPTWWGDAPPGPTLKRVGTAPACRNLHGEIAREEYAPGNTGWCCCPWHPEVQAAMRRARKAFLNDFPSDLLFQDQCGNRATTYDTNPAAPAADAYTEGLLSMLEENAAEMPIGAEDGWDRVAEIETGLFGCCWRVVPSLDDGTFHERKVRNIYPINTWELDPCALYFAHEKVLFWTHDLAQFVPSRRSLAWMLALGYNLSERARAGKAWTRDKAHYAWFNWLAALQRYAIAHIAGAPLLDYQHTQGADSATDDGSVVAQFGAVHLRVNLGDVPRCVEGELLAPYGWHITGPGFEAASRAGERAYLVAEGQRFEEPGAEIISFPPAKVADGQYPVPATWANVQGAWAVLAMEKPLNISWVRIWPENWINAVRAEAQAHGKPFIVLRTPAELRAALVAGAQKVSVILNPYGENIPLVHAEAWPETASALYAWLRAGGRWFETGGFSFHTRAWLENGTWKRAELGAAAAALFGIHIAISEDGEPPHRLIAREGDAEKCVGYAMVNRPFLETPGAPLTACVRDDRGRVWFGYYSFGAGRLYRVGGSDAPYEVLVPLIRGSCKTP